MNNTLQLLLVMALFIGAAIIPGVLESLGLNYAASVSLTLMAIGLIASIMAYFEK